MFTLAPSVHSSKFASSVGLLLCSSLQPMMAPLKWSCFLLVAGAYAASAAVTEIKDNTFDELTKDGAWMIDIYAPWCTHCRQLEPMWTAWGDEAKDLGISVGKIDGSKQKALVSRFHVTAYPSIYLLRNGSTWSYTGPRTLQAFKEFALTGYKQASAMPFYQAPNSLVGRLLGRLHSIPGGFQRAYQVLRSEYGYSDVAIVLGFLLIPVLTGALLICGLDAFYIRRAAADMLHDHQE